MRCASLRNSSGRSITASARRRRRKVRRRLGEAAAIARPTPRRSHRLAVGAAGREGLTLILPPSIDRWRQGGRHCRLVGKRRLRDWRGRHCERQQSLAKACADAVIEPVRQPDDLQARPRRRPFETLQQGRRGRDRGPWARGRRPCSRASRGGDGNDSSAGRVGAVVASATGTILPLGRAARFPRSVRAGRGQSLAAAQLSSTTISRGPPPQCRARSGE